MQIKKRREYMIPKGTLDAKAVGIKKPIDLSQFTKAALWSDNAIKCISDNKELWVYNLKDAQNVFKRILLRLEDTVVTLNEDDALEHNATGRISTLDAAIADGLQRNKQTIPGPVQLRAELTALALSDLELNELLNGHVPDRFRDKVGRNILAYSLYTVLGKPDDSIGKDLFWRKILEKNV